MHYNVMDARENSDDDISWRHVSFARADVDESMMKITTRSMHEHFYTTYRLNTYMFAKMLHIRKTLYQGRWVRQDMKHGRTADQATMEL